MWIKAHLLNGDVIHMQTQNIVAVYPFQANNVYNGQTVIRFVGDEDNWIRVKETVDEILSKIHLQ